MTLSRKSVLVLTASVVAVIAAAVFLLRDARHTEIAVQPVISGRPLALQAPLISAAAIKELRKDEVDWGAAYNETSNYFDFVSKASRSALDGDGKAARYISKALYICTPIAKTYANSADPEADFSARWAARTKAPQWIVDKARRDFQSCAGFIKGDAFAGLPDRPGGYNSSLFWIDLAAENNDSVAKTMEAGSSVAKTTFEQSSEAKAKALGAAQLAINDAVSSQDVGALFQVGRVLSDGHASSDPLQGFAVSIAACNLGYDCSASNKELFAECQGQCPSAISYADLIKQAVGEDGYAKAYVRAQELQDAIRRNDSNAVQKFVQLQPTS